MKHLHITILCCALVAGFVAPGSALKVKKPDLPKHKVGYTVRLTNLIFTKSDAGIFTENTTCWLNMINDTTAALNCYLGFLEDGTKYYTAHVRGYFLEPASNQWIVVVDQGLLPWCEFTKDRTLFMQAIIRASNLVGPCPPKKGVYYIKDAVFDANTFPEAPHDKKWRFELTLYRDYRTMEQALRIQVFVETPSIDEDDYE